MKAKELMTSDVVSVAPDTRLHDIARLMLEHTISAVPVVDSSGAPIGMVSEGDLIGRDEAARDARRDWWLAMLAEGEELSSDFLASFHPNGETARDVMAGPVVTVTEDTEAAEIARLLAAYRIKRVPVVRAGRLVGIVSRADLLRALVEARPEAPPPSTHPGFLSKTIAGIDRHFRHAGHPSDERRPSKPAEARGVETVNASDFRGLVADHELSQMHRHEEEHRAAVSRRKAMVKNLIDHHVGDESWQALLHEAREAAERGEKSFMLLRFPSQLCSDGGRAINVPDPDWPKTLRGEAAEIYLRWEHELKPHGFHLTAQVLDFPGGVPGDIGLFLVWGG